MFNLVTQRRQYLIVETCGVVLVQWLSFVWDAVCREIFAESTHCLKEIERKEQPTSLSVCLDSVDVRSSMPQGTVIHASRVITAALE